VTPEIKGMKALVSIDVGQNGKIFNKFYDNLLSTHDTANLNFLDIENVAGKKYSLFFKKGSA
jgi:hypothetical protein